jgi:protoporphyrinogen oxidase
MENKAIIIGAGPAGLTAAYELLKRTDIIPIILEKSGEIGGISRTINYKGNRMDMGPHRFFSKSDRVMDWWLNMMPISKDAVKEGKIHYQNKTMEMPASEGGGADDCQDPDKVMLVIQRLTRIYFLRKFFVYPIQLSLDTLRSLGGLRTLRILISFLLIRVFPRRPEKSLEDFIINKFGKELYLLFFKDYTEKVWGVPCGKISAEWGAQRIKGLSLGKAIAGAVRSIGKKKSAGDLRQKNTETSLIEQFLYPKYGPGSLWEEAAKRVWELGGKILLNQDVQYIHTMNGRVTGITASDKETGKTELWEGDFFFSTMPVQELIAGMGDGVPAKVREVASGLEYRDFINVGILLDRLSKPGRKPGEFEDLELKDNWVYIQERDVKVGRLMIYNNWGGGMVRNPDTVWLGMEYFCREGDELWCLSDASIRSLAVDELVRLGFAQADDVQSVTVQRMLKTYPAYFGTYNEFAHIRHYTDQFENLFLVGRNGMHKYNNADHSMLTAMVAVDNIIEGVASKENIWSINTEQEYHEEKKGELQDTNQTKAPEAVRSAANPGAFFSGYLWKNKTNRTYLIVAFACFLLQFILFKIRYPFANYMPDSYSYLEAAYSNADVDMWPVAYSKFLRLVSVFTHSDKVVVGLQYFFLQASSLIFLFSLLYFVRPGKIVRHILLAFFIFSPLPLYISNYISADALFIALSLSWMTVLVWLLFQPRSWQVPVQAGLLLACFTVRYNAIYYPLVAGLAFLLCRASWRFKASGMGLTILLVVGSYLYTSQKMETVTGTRQFSAFGGWQLANNALYMYEHIPAWERGPVPSRFAQLEKMVREHMDTLQRVKLTHEDSVNHFFYLWSGRGPLVHYMSQAYKKDSTTPYFKRWSSEGPLYADYAMYLVRRYPLAFASTFILPNAIRYAVPPAEFLGEYNMGSDSVGKLAKEWFNYQSQRVSNQKNGATIGIVQPYPVLVALLNLCFLFGALGFWIFGEGKADRPLTALIPLALAFWLLNSGFSLLASPIVLRYQVFPLMVFACFSLFFVEYLVRGNVASPTPSTIA